ncbi:hypothetical protein BGZ99_004954 [Dissophora globulifera]|uniref:Uncharacterized protein n=1 Tax=Dissophora globulifera TaxID=979702 RepID=A0A9P6RGD0_9FUNG|nr:hypothetical protein BGZ99_004954 [Dissophora globulifera]
MSTPSEILWDAFRADPASEDLYHPESHIVFLPTGAGAASAKRISEFFRTGGFSHPKKLSVEEKVIHRTVGVSSAVDEVEVTVKFVSGAGGWLLPSVDPYHLEDLTIVFPMVISGSFVEDRIASVRYVWDNASVLKMVRLIGSRQSWPIVAEAQIEALRNPSRFRLNPFGNVTEAAGSGPIAHTGISQILSSPPMSPPQKTAVEQQKKGHPALTSTVFSQYRNAPLPGRDDASNTPIRSNNNNLPLSPSISDESIANRSGASSPSTSGKKGHPALTSTLFNHLKNTDLNQFEEEDNAISRRQRTLSGDSNNRGYDESAVAGARATSPKPAGKKGHPALTSTVFSHLKEQPMAVPDRSPRQEQEFQKRHEEEERGAGWRADYVKPKGHPALTSSIFAKAPVSQPSSRPSRQEQQEQEQQQQQEEERGAGWSRDYVKPKGHPALTSTIFSQTAAAPSASSSRPYKKTSHNIFGMSANEKAKAQLEQQQQEQYEAEEAQEAEYQLEPSAIEAELERHEQQQQELKDIHEQEQLLEELEKQIQEQQELNAQDEEKKAEETRLAEEALLAEAVTPPRVTAPLSPPTSARKIHPNYKSSFTIGGPR